MKRLSNIFIAATVGFMLTGCGLYDKYEQKVDAPADAFGTTLISDASTEGASLAQMSWREFFSDPLLQQLIEQVLANNTDVNSARIAVEKSEASLKMAKLAYLPSLYFAPQGTLASFDKSAFSKTYTLPLQLSMDVDVFGSITNKKRAAKAVLLQAQLGEEATRSNLISAVAQQYYYLLLLDRQLEDFARQLSQDSLPVSELSTRYREALLLHATLDSAFRSPVADTQLQTQLSRFLRMKDVADGPLLPEDRLRQDFADTYWYYYFFAPRLGESQENQ